LGSARSDLLAGSEIIFVLDRRCRILPEVDLVRRWVIGVLGIWRGEGLGRELGQGRSVYKQPETEVDQALEQDKNRIAGSHRGR
jgi:hypothetical protein